MGRSGDVELDDLELAGERLRLRRWHPDDAERVAGIMRDTSMMQFLALPNPYTVEDARQFVTELGHEGRGEGSGLGCAVVEQATGRLVGAAALRMAGDPEIGFWVAPDSRGHGFAAEATRVLTRFGFSLGLARIQLDCDVRNLASAATALAAGFRFEGVARAAVVSAGRGGIPERSGDLARFARVSDDPDEPIEPAFPRLTAGELDDGTLALRMLLPQDAQGLGECEDAESVRWNFTGAPRSASQAAATATRAGLDWLVGTTARFAMVDVATGDFAGELNLRRSGPPQIGGVGYTVHPQFRGRGYTTRALRLVASWTFDRLDLARLELGAKTDNVASQRAAASAGFTPDGIRRTRMRNADGSFGDEVRFALLNPRYSRALHS